MAIHSEYSMRTNSPYPASTRSKSFMPWIIDYQLVLEQMREHLNTTAQEALVLEVACLRLFA